MILLVLYIFCGLLALGAAIVIQFRLPLYLTVTGLALLKREDRLYINENALRRRVSLVYYLFSFSLFAACLALYLNRLDERAVVLAGLGMCFVAVNAIYLILRRCDGAERTPARVKGSRLGILTVDLLICIFALLTFFQR